MISSRLQSLLVLVLIGIGLTPLLYFVTIEMGVAEAVADDPAEEFVLEGPFDRYIKNVAFGVNEKLSFDINYGFINAGTAEMEVARLVDYENRPCYQLVTHAKSNSFFSSVYKVEDRVESIIDAVGLYSWRFEKKLREGKYRAERIYTFDQRNGRVFYKNDTIETPSFVQDALSALYFIRTQDLKVGQSLFFESFADGKLYTMEVRILKKEKITVEAGTFDCLVVEPLMQAVGVFKHQGNLKVWLTDDRLRMPVLMKSKVLVGSISAELTDYRLGEIESF